jgi:hypothetical protein
LRHSSTGAPRAGEAINQARRTAAVDVASLPQAQAAWPMTGRFSPILNHDLIVALAEGTRRRLRLQHDRFIDLQFIESAAAPPNRLVALAAPF